MTVHRPSAAALKVAFVGLLAVVIWSVAAPANADPGHPGLDDASRAVYPIAGPPPVPPGDEEIPGTVEDTQFTGVASEEDGGSPNASVVTPPGGPPSGPSATTPSPQSSLPFTGLLAPVLLGVGLLMLAAGLIARKLHSRGVSS